MAKKVFMCGFRTLSEMRRKYESISRVSEVTVRIPHSSCEVERRMAVRRSTERGKSPLAVSQLDYETARRRATRCRRRKATDFIRLPHVFMLHQRRLRFLAIS
jgi:hypothetical protein